MNARVRIVLAHRHFRTIVFLRLCALLLVLPTEVARAETILLNNDGFESGFSGWTYVADDPSTIETSADAHSGSTSMHLTKTENGYIYQMTGHIIATGDEIALRFWVKDAGYAVNPGWDVQMMYLDGSDIKDIEIYGVGETSQWREVMLVHTASAGDDAIGKELGVYFGDGRKGILLDDVAVEINHTICVGNGTVYSSQESIANANVRAMKVTMSEGGTLHSVKVHIRQNEAKLVRYAVYADSAGGPGALLAESKADVTDAHDYHWHAIPMPPTLLPAGDYWVAMSFEHSSARYRYQTGGDDTHYYSGSTALSGYPTTWPSSSTQTRSVSMVMCYTDPTVDLAGYWKLDETSGYTAYDSSGYDHNGVLTNIDPTTAWMSAQCGNGLEFNGFNSSVVVPDHDDFDDTSALTVAFWCFPYTLDGNPRGPISKRVHWTTQYSWGIFFYTGDKLFVDIEGNDDRFSSNTVFTEDDWVHIAVVFDGSLASNERAKIYVNGVLDKTAPESSTSISNTTSDVVLGDLTGNGNGYFHGILDEVRVYRRVLTVTDILDVMACSGPSVTSVVKWKELTK